MRFQLAVWCAIFALAVAVPARAEELTIALAVRGEGFEPARIAAPPGSRIRLEVTNQTAGAIEFESFELNRERVIQSGQTVTVYVSGLSAGQYEFFDDFNQARRGVLAVE